jgi:hypothetical protein
VGETVHDLWHLCPVPLENLDDVFHKDPPLGMGKPRLVLYLTVRFHTIRNYSGLSLTGHSSSAINETLTASP